MAGRSPGLTATMTEVADLWALDSKFGLRYLGERICIFELRIESARLGKNSPGPSGGKVSGLDRQLDLVRGEAKGQAGRVAQRK